MSRTLLIAMMVAGPLFASADPKTPTAADKQRAAEAFVRGRSAYSFGNYDVAIREYQVAFDLTGAPEYVFNIAQTQRAKGDKHAALASYKQYIELDPQGAGVASAQSHVEALQQDLDAEAAATTARAKAAAEAEARRTRQVAEAAEAARRDATEIARRRVAAADLEQRRATSRYFRIAGLSTAGLGVATLGGSAYFGMRARSLSRRASNVTGTWTEEAQADIDGATSAERIMFVLLAVGGGVAVTGGVLYLIGAQSPERTIVIAPTGDGAAAILQGRF